jgi:hypothetical protein
MPDVGSASDGPLAGLVVVDLSSRPTVVRCASSQAGPPCSAASEA